MKLKANYVLREVAGENIVIPVDSEAINFNGIMTLNETGKFLWNQLKQEVSVESLIASIVDNYEVDRNTAAQDVTAFIEKLRKHNVLEDGK
ncbi:MAG: PqqD family protein [Candidatus Izemoplasmatales bacterium]|jgi:hypothetical protein